jgi:predicted adenylyl cyclase CyaB
MEPYRNIEIKARAADWNAQKRIAEEVSDYPGQRSVQEDTFFNVRAGRLKLRMFDDGRSELIQYQREDAAMPKESHYICVPMRDAEPLKFALSNALGIRGIIRKQRHLYLVGRTRIHLDEVEGLGKFVELEVVLQPLETREAGISLAEYFMSKLGIEKRSLIEGAYIDLLLQ